MLRVVPAPPAAAALRSSRAAGATEAPQEQTPSADPFSPGDWRLTEITKPRGLDPPAPAGGHAGGVTSLPGAAVALRSAVRFAAALWHQRPPQPKRACRAGGGGGGRGFT